MRAFSDALRYEPAELPDVHVTTMLRAEEALGYPAMSTIPTGRARFEPATVRPLCQLSSSAGLKAQRSSALTIPELRSVRGPAAHFGPRLGPRGRASIRGSEEAIGAGGKPSDNSLTLRRCHLIPLDDRTPY